MLMTAGCSFVWGDELEGFDNDPATHWELTFTHLLGQKLGIEHKNLGICGACNDKIFRQATDFLHENPGRVTHMVIMWSALQRKELVEYMPPKRQVKIGRQNDVTQFSSLRTDCIYSDQKRSRWQDWYDNAYDSKTDILHMLVMMKNMEVIARAAGIKLIQGSFHQRNWSNILSVLTDKLPPDSQFARLPFDSRIDNIPEYKQWLKDSIGNLDDNSRVGMGRGKDLYTLAIEGDDLKPHGHPGEKTQVVFTDFLYEKFVDMDS
jgi:hypothetical protein